MEATIKETVKNIFKSHTFEDAVELTKQYCGEYIREFGVKSWNGMMTYYKNASITPEPVVVAEPEAEYPADDAETPETDATEADDNALEVSDDANDCKQEENETEVETVEYMLYQNAGDKIDWYGHFVNYKGLKVGDEDWMIRMNNLGVGMGRVIAAAQMTLPEINIFHKCYAVIRANTQSDNRRVMLFKRAFNNLKDAMNDPAFTTKTKSKDICDFVLNYDSNK